MRISCINQPFLLFIPQKHSFGSSWTNAPFLLDQHPVPLGETDGSSSGLLEAPPHAWGTFGQTDDGEALQRVVVVDGIVMVRSVEIGGECQLIR